MFRRQPTHKRVLGLLDYLVELADLRARTVLDVAAYEDVLWLAEFCDANGGLGRLTGDESADLWLEIRRPLAPRPPSHPPGRATPWSGAGEAATAIGGEFETRTDAPTDTRLLAEPARPAARGLWQRLQDDGGHEHAKRETAFRRADELFRRLSQLHQAELRLGEEYELVLGVGLLCWQPPDGPAVRRHLITANATLSFDAELASFSLGPAFDGSPLRAEIDMLDVRDRPREVLRAVERALLAAGGDPLRRRTVDRVLAAFARGLPLRGRYEAERLLPPAPSEISAQPRVLFAPALLLRRRSHRGVRMALQKIRTRIEAGGPVPPLLLDLCELPHDGTVDAPLALEREPLFPLPVNREQLRVRERAAQAVGTLVQGPPGTGKTHTIANLLCDLLAAGNRVLVTAQTPRTLRALRRLLPEEIRPLCVHWLGTGAGERPALEDGVRRIVDRHLLHDRASHAAEIVRLRGELEQLRIEETELLARMSRGRSAAGDIHAVPGDAYRGTLAEIASQLAGEREALGFLDDEVAADAPPFHPRLLEELFDSYEQIATQVHGAGLLRTEALDDLPTPDEFEALVRLEIESRNAETALATAPFCGSIEGVSPARLQALGSAFRDLHAAVTAAWRRAPQWAATAMRDIFRDRAAVWRELEVDSTLLLDRLLERARRADQQDLKLPQDVDLIALARDGEDLRGHLLGGGRIRRGLFRAPVVNRTLYLWRDVRIDGRKVDNPDALKELLAHLAVRRDVDALWRRWSPHLLAGGGALAAQVVEIHENLVILRELLQLGDLQTQARRALHDVPGLPEPRWHDPTSLADYCESARGALADPGRREVAARFDLALRALERAAPPQPPRIEIVDQLVRAIRERDRLEYRRAHAAIDEAARAGSLLRRRAELIERLSAAAPRLIHRILADHNRDRWRRRLPHMRAAYEHARARTWLTRRLAETDDQPLRQQLAVVEQQRRRTVAELAAALAWQHCFARMTDEHRRHLVAWGQAMRGIGNGSGRSAARHRREAQVHLLACRDAVPAWIMPLHRVFDTIEPIEEAFDVVIVDDASQCGQDALPLLYLARRVIVVGDDQQIRPTPVGIDDAHVDHLLDTWLGELVHRDSFRPEHSLFDHAVRRCGERVVLREHFRCQPEIIRFSDELCYRATPLLPMRRLAANRLVPLRRVYVPGATREGRGAAAVNVREAEAVAEAVIAASAAERYRGLTFGVICLQGQAQARRIEERLLRELGPEECERRRLVCGNPYSFQGDERDVVFLSMVAAPNDLGPALTRADFVRRFNVAASRARDQMWLFHSVTRDELSELDLRRRLLEFFEAYQEQPHAALPAADALSLDRLVDRHGRPPAPFTHWLQIDVLRALRERGYQARPLEPFAGGRLDLVVEGERQSLAIECDEEDAEGDLPLRDALERQRLLERAGWRIARVRRSAFCFDQELGLAAVTDELRHLAITPQPAAEGLAPYPTFAGALPDSLAAPREQVVAAVLGIVEQEGPVSGRRIQRLLASAAAVDVIDARLGLAVDEALRESLGCGRLRRIENGNPSDLTDCAYLAGPDRPMPPRLRGPRRFAEIPKGEIAAVLRAVWHSGSQPIDLVFRRVLATFEVHEPDADDLDRIRAALLYSQHPHE